MADQGVSRAEHDAVRDALRTLVLAANRFRYAMARLGEYSPREAALLAHLLDAGGQATPSELADQLLVSSGTLTAILRKLESRGDLVRTPHPDDLRATLVTLQPAGRAASAEVIAVLDRVAATVLAEVDVPTGALLRTLDAATRGLDGPAGRPRPVTPVTPVATVPVVATVRAAGERVNPPSPAR